MKGTISPCVVANTILQRGFDEHVEITPLKLQKLLYFVYRDYLKHTDQHLYAERFEAWPYGPVLRSVYDEFHPFHGNPITKFARNADGTVSVLGSGDTDDVCHSISRVWEKYKNYPGVVLSQLTHLEGTAWDYAWQNHEQFLDDAKIKDEEIL